MHGNVWEWCLDEWRDSYEGAPTDGRAWGDAAEGEKSKESVKAKLLRGGSWNDYPWFCRSAYRNLDHPVNSIISIGFRVVCLPQGPSLNPSIPQH
jgi:formylglycine-generating enzyme required for sulfatase activity